MQRALSRMKEAISAPNLTFAKIQLSSITTFIDPLTQTQARWMAGVLTTLGVRKISVSVPQSRNCAHSLTLVHLVGTVVNHSMMKGRGASSTTFVQTTTDKIGI